MNRILIIENEQLSCLGWSKLIADNFPDASLSFADKITDALSVSPARLHADLIILSITRPMEITRSYASVTTQILRMDIPLLIYYVPAVYKTALYFIRSGAKGGISSRENTENLVKGISALLRKQRYFCRETEERIIDYVLDNDFTTVEYKMSSLSTREQEVANYLAGGLKTSDISKRLNLKMSTISTFKLKIFSKMEVNNVLQLAEKMRSF